MQKFARSLLAIGETYVAKNYLDTEMYYTGKFVVDAYKYATSKAGADAFNLLYNIITGGDTAALTEMGVWGGGATSMSSVKVLANGDTLVEAGTAKGAAVIIGGVLILGMGASTNAASRENMQEDQDRINAEKENAETQKKLDELLNSDYYKNNPGYDCSEIADDLYDAANGKGNILRIEGKNGGINGYEYNRIENFDYHGVYTDGQYIYDPRYQNSAVLKDDYFRAIKEINSNGFDVFTVR